jgi:endonuclease III
MTYARGHVAAVVRPKASRRRTDVAEAITADVLPVNFKLWRGRVVAVADRLAQVYGSPRLGNVKDPTSELFYILLSNRSEPSRCAATFRELKVRFHPWSCLLNASVSDVQAVLRPLGMDRVRAERILGIAARLRADFGAVSLQRLRTWPVLEALRYLTALPGVGEKSARCVLMYSLGHDLSPVDVHQLRILVRTGLLAEGTTVQAAHRILDRFLPEGCARRLHVNLVAHGRAVCTARKPDCAGCLLLRRCPTGLRLVH